MLLQGNTFSRALFAIAAAVKHKKEGYFVIYDLPYRVMGWEKGKRSGVFLVANLNENHIFALVALLLLNVSVTGVLLLFGYVSSR